MRSFFLTFLLASLGFSASQAASQANKSKKKNSAVASALAADSFTVNGQTAGPTPFVVFLNLTVTPATSLQSAQFLITPKSGSVTRPVSATYTKEYLQSRSDLNTTTGAVTVPVFGLYSGFTNSVTITCNFTDGTAQQMMVTMITPPFTNTSGQAYCGQGTTIVTQARTNSTLLSYDYFLAKSPCGISSPMIVDTDGNLRWMGIEPTTSFGWMSSAFFDNAVYISQAPPATPTATPTGIGRFEMDGSYTFIQDYASSGVTNTDHHNLDPGKQGLLLEVNTTTQTESTVKEIDACGQVLKTWDLGQILHDAIVAGGENPNNFVYPPNNDWFHNNAVAYRKSDDSLIVSSRENFLICLDYNTGAIKWILGDPTKYWYVNFPNSLRHYALTLTGGSLPPIGQHAVSITNDDNIMCFDNGTNSLYANFLTAPGASRTYSSPRIYHIDPQAKTATEIWNYPNGQSVSAPFCSSVYEDDPLNYLVNYAYHASEAAGNQHAEILGLDSTGAKVFDYQFVANTCSTAWNSIPVHLENMLFVGPDPLTAPGGWKITSTYFSAGNPVIRFPAAANQGYRVEYKDQLTDASWQTVADITPTCHGVALVADTTAAGHTHRSYRVRTLP